MTTVFPALLRELEAGRPAMLAVIVTDEGSSPREAGSMMLTGVSGRIAGTIGGGAVEMIAGETARTLLARGVSETRSYRLQETGPDAAGMACGGNITVFFQFFPAGEASETLAREVLARLKAGRPGFLLLRPEGPALTDEEHPGRSVPLSAEPRAVLFGGGHIALELAPLLRRVGFRVAVFDDRPEFSDPARFPMAEETVCGDYENIAASLSLRPEDYVVIITEGHRHDFAVERQALACPLAYIGAIGSKTKTDTLNRRLLDCGFTPADLERLHAPIGMRIKSSTPAEIAVSIAGELILVRARRREGAVKAPCPMR